MNFTITADRREKSKESKKLDKYQDLARELKNRNMTVAKTIHKKGQLRSARMLKRVLESSRDVLLLRIQLQSPLLEKSQ